jgi:hypothetical protein
MTIQVSQNLTISLRRVEQGEPVLTDLQIACVGRRSRVRVNIAPCH